MKTRMNRMVSLLLTIVMLWTMLPTGAFASEVTDAEDYIQAYEEINDIAVESDAQGAEEYDGQEPETPALADAAYYDDAIEPHPETDADEHVPAVSGVTLGEWDEADAEDEDEVYEIAPAAEPLKAEWLSLPRYGVHGVPFSAVVAIEGGAAPYACVVNGYAAAEEDGAFKADVTPDHSGSYGIEAEIVDALGETIYLNAALPVSTGLSDAALDWRDIVGGLMLTGDAATDLVAVAYSQLGYAVSQDNFIITEDGAILGYTRYGDWAGDAYGPWNAAFAAFCLEYADIPATEFPRAERADLWASLLGERFMAANGDYRVRPGDLAFFDRDGDGAADGVGIVTVATETAIHTIEGRDGAVREYGYDHHDAAILGYGCLVTEGDAGEENIENTEEENIETEETEKTGETEDAEAGEAEGEDAEQEQSPEDAEGEDEDAEDEDGEEEYPDDFWLPEEQYAYPAFRVENQGVAGTNITISVDAPEGAFPEGIQMIATLIATPGEMLDGINSMLDDDQAVSEADTVTFDIRFCLPEDPDTEIEPLVPISVTFGNLDYAEGTLSVYHADLENIDRALNVNEVASEIPATDSLTVTDLDSFSAYTIANVLRPRAVEPGEGDQYVTIRRLSYELRNGAEKNADGDWVWTATNNYADHGFIFRVYYATSGTYEFQPGEIMVRIPKSILVNRKGEPSDYFAMGLPEESDPNLKENNIYVYKVEGDDIVVYNRVKVPAGQSGYFDVSYITNERTYEYADYLSNKGKNPKGASEPFQAKITIRQPGVVESDQTDKTPVYIDTVARITSTSKNYPTASSTWSSGWGLGDSDPVAPPAGDSWYYLVWEIRSNIESGSQPYTFSLADTFAPTDADGNPIPGSVVAYKMQGGSYVLAGTPGAGSVSGQKTTTSRYDYVITRHSLNAQEAGITSPEGKFTVQNSEVAKVHPEDGVDPDTTARSSRSWTIEAPRYQHPVGHFYMYKYGLDYRNSIVRSSNDIRNFMLTEFHAGLNREPGGITELPDLAYYTYVHGYPYPWTADGALAGDESDVDKYGKKNVTYVLTDRDFSLAAMGGSDTGKLLTVNDYYITSIDLDYSYQDAAYDPEAMRFVARPVTYTDNDIITVYVEYNNNNSYLRAASYNLKTGTWATHRTGVTASGKTVSFSGKTITGYKLTTTNAHYYTRLGAYPHVTLKNSATVKAIVDEAMAEEDQDAGIKAGQQKIALTNVANSAIHMGDNESGSRITGFNRSGTDYATGRTKHGYISKSVTGYRNDTVDREYIISWAAEAYGNYQEMDGSRVYERQPSGVFYDLLPAGGVYRAGTVAAYADGKKLPEGQYAVEVIQNYRDSGRTLLVIRINVPGDKYRFSYTTTHSWESIKDYGHDELNSVAYESGNEDIGDGRPDDGGTITEKELMTDLDPNSNNKRFLYAQAKHSIRALTAASLGLDKQVLAEDDQAYSYSTRTYTSGDYSYRLRFSTDDNTRGSDLILYDSLENYVVKMGATAGDASEWRGTLTGVDLSQLTGIGVAPVVYYSTVENLDIEEHNDLDNDNVWSTHIDDLANARAIAIDMRKKADGEDFVMPKDTSLAVTLFMRAPATVLSDDLEPLSYNNIYLHGIVENMLTGDSTTPLIHQDYTRIRYRTVGDLELVKVDSTDHDIKVEGVTFRLWGISDYGTDVDETRTSGVNGRIPFGRLERGTYRLQEIDGVPDYQQDASIMTVVVDENGNVTVTKPEEDSTPNSTFALIREGDAWVVENAPRIHGDLEFMKKGMIDGSERLRNLTGVVFKLEGTSDYGNEFVEYASSVGGSVRFDNIELGSYALTETETIEGYIPSDKEYTVVCNEDGLVYIIYEDENGETVQLKQDVDTGDLNIVNEPYHSFMLKKVDPADELIRLPGAVFSLTGVSDFGNSVDMSVATNGLGIAEFENIEPGSYVLKETVAPNNYQLDDTERLVTVAHDGTVTIDGLEFVKAEPYTDCFAMPNERTYEGVITIVKKWEGDSNSTEDRPIPVVHLDTEEPYLEELEATISRDRWDAYVNRLIPNNISQYKKGFMRTDGCNAFKRDFSKDLSWLEANAVRIDDQYDDPNAMAKIFAWREGDTAYWWSNADTVYLPEDSSDFFAYSPELTELKYFNTSKVIDMSDMFYNTFATTLDFSSFDTSNVKYMTNMFCAARLTSPLDLSSFDTSNVERFNLMFQVCKAPAIDVSSFDFSSNNQEYSQSGIFRACENLTYLDLSSCKFGNPISFSGLFEGCTNLKRVDFPDSYATIKVTSMHEMFIDCANLESVDLRSIDSSSLTNMNYAFRNCKALKEADLSSFDTKSCTYSMYMFNGCTELKTIYVGDKWNLSAVSESNSQGMFGNCDNLVGQTGYKIPTSERNHYRNKRYANYGTRGVLTYKAAPSTGASIDNGTMLVKASPAQGSATALSANAKGRSAFRTVGAIQAARPAVVPALPASRRTVEARVATPAASGSGLVALAGETGEGSDGEGGSGDGEGDGETDPLPEVIITNLTSESVIWTNAFGESDPDAVYDQWIINEDGTWTYRFRVFDQDAIYYAWEEKMAGYTSTHMEQAEKVTYTAGSRDTTVTITNKKDKPDDPGDPPPTPSKGSLAVRKAYPGATGAEKDRAFEIEVTLSASGSFGGVNFTANTPVTVSLKAGEQASFTGIPAGTRYTVREVVPDGYKASYAGSGTIGEDNVTGTITANATAAITVTNVKGGALEIEKTVTAAEGAELTDADKSKKFLFTVTLDDASVNGIYDGVVFKNGTAQLSLAHDEVKRISGLPANVGYTVTERAEEGFKATSTGDTGTIPLGDTTEASFTNTKQPEPEVKRGSFTLTKTVVGEAGDQGFEFHIALSGLKAGESYALSDGTTFTASASGTANLTRTLKDGQRLEFSGLPLDALYRVTEEASRFYASYAVTNAAEQGSIASASGANTAVNRSLSTAAEQVDEGEQVTVAFTNTGATYRISISKNEATTAQDEVGRFLEGAVLRLVRVNADNSETEIAQWTSQEDFRDISLTEGKYKLKEIQAPAGYMSAEDVTFTVDEGGVIRIEGEEDYAYFVSMSDEPTRVTVDKQDETGAGVDGARLAILDAEGDTVASWTSDGKGFEITGVLALGASYTLREISAPDGYERAADIAFTLNDQGQVMVNGVAAGDNRIAMTDRQITSVTVKKTWNDDNDRDGLRASAGARVSLYKKVGSGAAAIVAGSTVDVGTGDDWSHTWENLPVTELDAQGARQQITYSVTETLARNSGYTASYENNALAAAREDSGTVTVTNVHTPATVTFRATKTWASLPSGVDKPDVYFQLFRKAGESGAEEAVPDAEIKKAPATGYAQWTRLDKNYENGQAYIYSVKEVTADGAAWSHAGFGEPSYEYSPDHLTATVTNTYTPANATAEVLVAKQLNGRAWKSGDSYEFTITAADGTPMPASTTARVTAASEKLNASDASTLKAGFGAINFNREHLKVGGSYLAQRTFDYKVQEVIPDDAVNANGTTYAAASDAEKADTSFKKNGVTYAKAAHSVHITLKANADGTLSAEVKYGESSADAPTAFVNDYSAAPTRFGIAINKLENGALKGGYSFGLYDNNGSDAELRSGIRAAAGKNAQGALIGTSAVGTTGSFSGTVEEIEFTKPGTYRYQLKEINDNKPGVTYDAKAVDVIVTVTDDGEGQLASSVSYGTNAGPQDAANAVAHNTLTGATFENTYDATGTAIMHVDKHISGREWLDSDSFTFTLTGVDGAPVRTSAGGATVANVTTTATRAQHDPSPNFPTLHYQLSDLGGETEKVFTYKVSETSKMPGGMTKAADREIKVKVSDAAHNGVLTVSYAAYDSATGAFKDPMEWNQTMDAPDMVNVYTITDEKAVTLQAAKVITDQAGAEVDSWIIAGEHDWSASEFAFVLLSSSADAPMPDGAKARTDSSAGRYARTETNASLASDKLASFGEIKYTKPGTYLYDIREVRADKKADANAEGYVDGLYIDDHLIYSTTAHAVTVVVADNGDGKLADPVVTYGAGAAGSATPSVFHNEEQGDAELVLAGRKQLNGKALEAGMFQFELYRMNGANDTETTDAKRIDTGTVTASGLVEKVVEFNLADLNGADEKTFYFAGKEVQGTNPGMTYSQATHRYAVTVARMAGDATGIEVTKLEIDNGSGTFAEVALTTDAATGQKRVASNDSWPVHTNTYQSSGTATLDASKHIEGRDYWNEGEEYTFTLTGENGAPIHIMDGTTVADSAMLTATATSANRIVDFPELRFTEADMDGRTEREFTYRIHEICLDLNELSDINPAEGGAQAEGVTYAPDQLVTVKLTDDGEGHLVATYLSRDGEWTESLVNPQFINQYAITGNVEVPLDVEKTLTGREWTTDDRFEFRLTALTPDAPMPEDDTLVIDLESGFRTYEEGTLLGSFDPIVFEAVGTYTYQIEEIEGDIPGIRYAAEPCKVTVTVVDDGYGGLMCETAYDGDGLAAFTNEYTAEGTAKVLVKKALEAEGWKHADSFEFTLTPADADVPLRVKEGDQIAEKECLTVTATDGEAVAFDEIYFELADAGKTYAYAITETVPEGAIDNWKDGIAYNAEPVAVTIAVTDNGDGSLGFDISYDGEAAESAVIRNSWEPETPPEIAKDVNGKAHEDLKARDEVFTYNIKTAIPEYRNLNSFVVTDTLESVLAFEGDASQVTVTVDGETVTGAAAISGKTLTVTMPEAYLAEAYRGKAVVVSFKAKIVNGANLSAYANNRVPNKASYQINNDPKVDSNTVTVTPPSPTTTTNPPGGGGNPNPTPTPRPTTEVSGSKIWNDQGDVYGVRPESVTIELLADGEVVKSQEITGEGDTWAYKFTRLPELSASGATIEYTVREIPVEYYESSVDGTTITNTLEEREPTYTKVEGVKTWNDNDNADGKRPDSIVVWLYRDGEKIDSRTVLEANGWRYSFENLIEDNGYGATYTYTVREDAVPGYFQRVEGYDITNTRLPEPPTPDVPRRRTPPEFGSKTEEELEGLVELFDYDTPLWGGLLGTGDDTPVYPYVFGGVGFAAVIALAVLALAQKRKKNRKSGAKA